MLGDSAKRRVLCVIRWPVGGIRTWCRYVYLHPAFREFPLTIAAPGGEFTEQLAADLAGCDVSFVPLPNDTRKFLRGIRALATSSKWSLLHSHGFTAAGAMAIAKIGVRAPHLITQHDVILNEQYRGFKGELQRQAVSMTLRSADVVHSVSGAASRNLIESFPWLRGSAKVRVITNGIDASRFLHASARDLKSELGLGQDSFLVGFFGRFMGQKGFRHLLDAIAILKSAHPEVRTPIVVAPGGGGFFDRDKRRIAELGLEQSFRFVPFAPDLGPLIKAVDVVAMPSLWEACGLLAMETLAAGVPLICSDCESLTDIGRDSPATIIPRGDPHALAAAIAAEVERPTRERAAEYAPAAAARFEVSHAARELAELYDSLASR